MNVPGGTGGNDRLYRRRAGGYLPRNDARDQASATRRRFSVGEGNGVAVTDGDGLIDDQVAKRALVAGAMIVMMPDHAESHRHQEDDQPNGDDNLPGSRLVRHLESIQDNPIAHRM